MAVTMSVLLTVVLAGVGCVFGQAPGAIPQGVTVPSTAPVDYPLVFKTPDGCGVGDCAIYVGIAVNEGNSDYLNFYIEGDAEAWVAVGVSATEDMPNTDVMACNRISGGEMVEVLDTWNPGLSNEVDNVQDTFMYNSSVVNGRIFCNFGRSIAGAGDSQDLNLDAKYFVLFGASSGRTSSGVLISHRTATPQSNPFISEEQFNIVRDSGVAGASGFENIRNGLVRAHGIFMLIAWLLLVQVAVHFAWYMRPALPNGEWFQVHRALMIISLFLSLLGFILIFISQARRSTPGLVDLRDGSRRAHFIIGLVIVVFQIANPIIAIFRCHPGDKKRWIFNMIHGYMVGQWSSILSMTNIGLGVAIFSTSYSQWGNLNIFWVFLAYIVFNILTHVVLILLSCWVGRKHCRKCNCARCGCKCDSDKSGGAVSMSKGDETVAMEDKAKGGDDGEEEEKKKRKEPAEGSIWLWIVMGVNIAVIAIFTFVLLVMVALPQ